MTLHAGSACRAVRPRWLVLVVIYVPLAVVVISSFNPEDLRLAAPVVHAALVGVALEQRRPAHAVG